jgi:hypothetical protein
MTKTFHATYDGKVLRPERLHEHLYGVKRDGGV